MIPLVYKVLKIIGIIREIAKNPIRCPLTFLVQFEQGVP